MKDDLVFGGSGQIGAAMRRHFDPDLYRITSINRRPRTSEDVAWDGKAKGKWSELLETADVVVNLAGRRVHCRYNAENVKEMMDSQVESTRVLGEAIAKCQNPPTVWFQSSTATLYAHTFGPANDDVTGIIGGNESGRFEPAAADSARDLRKAWGVPFGLPAATTRSLRLGKSFTDGNRDLRKPTGERSPHSRHDVDSCYIERRCGPNTQVVIHIIGSTTQTLVWWILAMHA